MKRFPELSPEERKRRDDAYQSRKQPEITEVPETSISEPIPSPEEEREAKIADIVTKKEAGIDPNVGKIESTPLTASEIAAREKQKSLIDPSKKEVPNKGFFSTITDYVHKKDIPGALVQRDYRKLTPGLVKVLKSFMPLTPTEEARITETDSKKLADALRAEKANLLPVIKPLVDFSSDENNRGYKPNKVLTPKQQQSLKEWLADMKLLIAQ